MTDQIPLGEVCNIVMGQSPPSTTYNERGNGLPFFQGKADFGAIFPTSRVFCSQPVRIAEPGDILISVRAPVGPTNLTRERSCIGRGLSALRPTSKLDPRFLLFFLRFYEPQLAERGLGSTFSAINRDDLESIPVPLLTLLEQRRIAQLLAEADRLRRMRRYALQMCDELLPSSFLEIFGDPASNPRSYPIVLAEELFDDTRGGAKCGPFGSALKNAEYVHSGIPVWTMENVQSNHFTEDGCLYITDTKFQQLKAYAVIDGDILISRAGTVGRMAIVRTRHDRSIMHSNLIRLALNHALVLPEYFVVLMTWFGARIAKLKTGHEDAYTFMNTGTLAELPIPLPTANEQKLFLSFLRRHEQLRAVHAEALRQSDHLFQTLLHQAFAGR